MTGRPGTSLAAVDSKVVVRQQPTAGRPGAAGVVDGRPLGGGDVRAPVPYVLNGLD